MSNNDIIQLAKRIKDRGNHQVGDKLIRMAQALDGATDGEFNESGHVPIESYVRPQAQQASQVHTATVSFEAPQGVSEADIMEYVMGIREALGVTVNQFNWSVKDSKQKA